VQRIPEEEEQENKYMQKKGKQPSKDNHSPEMGRGMEV